MLGGSSSRRGDGEGRLWNRPESRCLSKTDLPKLEEDRERFRCVSNNAHLGELVPKNYNYRSDGDRFDLVAGRIGEFSSIDKFVRTPGVNDPVITMRLRF